MQKDLCIRAKDIKVGDYVWEHGPAESITKTNSGKILVFNLGKMTEWQIHPNEEVMVHRVFTKYSFQKICQ